VSFPDALARAAALTQARLDAALADGADVPVVHAMRHAVQGGKRLRAFLVLEGAAMFGIAAPRVVGAAAAVEALHAYSLVHDDLPSMDDDDLRRGQPTVHRRWDEATAVLAGDALQTLAFDLLADPSLGSAEVRIALVAGLARASGHRGMVLGQARDIAAETAGRALTLDEITTLQAGKTGALIGFAAEAGAVIAGQDPAPLRAYAAAMGLAFQIADDVLDAAGDAGKAGKALRKDAAAHKATFVSHLGLDGARVRARSLVDEACAALAPYGARAHLMQEAARFAVARDR
jgi:farnesyl diphosphate synthase